MKAVKQSRLTDRRDEIVLTLYAFFIPAVSLATVVFAS